MSNRILMVFFFIIMLVNMQVSYAGSEEEAIEFHLVSTSSVLVSPPSLSDGAASSSKLSVSDKECIIVLKVKNIDTIGNVKIMGVSSEPGNEIFTVDSDDFFNLYKCKGELKPGESCLVRARILVKDKIDENKLLPVTISYSLGEKTYDVTSEVSLLPNTSIVLDQQVNSGSKLNELDFSKESPKFFLKNVSGSVLDIKNISIESGVATAECEDSLSNFQADGTLKVTMPLTRSEYFLRFFNKKIDDDYIVVSYSEVGKDEVKEVYIPIVTTLQYSKSAWGITVAVPIVVVATATAIVCVTLHCGVVTALGYVGYYGAVWPIKTVGYYGIVCPLKYGLYYPIKWLFGYGYGPYVPPPPPGGGAAVFAMPAVVNTVNVGIALRFVGATYDRGRWYDAAGVLINPASAIGMIMSVAGVIYNGGRWYVGAVGRANLVN